MEAEATKIKWSILFLLCLTALTSYSQKWERLPDFDLTRRMGAVSFSWEGKGYIGCGHDYNARYPFNDLTSFDTTSRQWTEVTWLDSGFRTAAFSFLQDGNFYIGGGTRDSGRTALRDFYRFDLTTHHWTRVNDLPFRYAVGASAVVCDQQVYVLGGCSMGGCDSNVWRYRADSDQWEARQALPIKSMYGIAFALQHEIYFGLGNGPQGLAYSAIWSLNPKDTGWKAVSSFTTAGRNLSVAIALDSVYAVAGLGFRINDYLQQTPVREVRNGQRFTYAQPECDFMMKDLWLYSAVSKRWRRLPSMKQGRRGAIAFRLDHYLYVGMGNADDKITKDVYRLDLDGIKR